MSLLYLHYQWSPFAPLRDASDIDDLETHLRGRQDWISWGPRQVPPGGAYQTLINNKLREAARLVALVTPEAIIDAAWMQVVRDALRDRQVLIPLLLLPTDLSGTPLAGIMPVPRQGHPSIRPARGQPASVTWHSVVQDLLLPDPPPFVTIADLRRAVELLIPTADQPAFFATCVEKPPLVPAPQTLDELCERSSDACATSVRALTRLFERHPTACRYILRVDDGARTDRLIPLIDTGAAGAALELRRDNLREHDPSISQQNPVRLRVKDGLVYAATDANNVELAGQPLREERPMRLWSALHIGTLRLVLQNLPLRIKTRG